MNNRKGTILHAPSSLRIRLSRHLAWQYLTHAAVYMILVMGWLYYYMTHIWDRIGPGSGGRIELPRIILFLIGFGLPVVVWFLYTIVFLQKPLRYLDDLLGATSQLAADKEQPIVLPEVMKEAENELNEVRLQAILDERMLLENEEKKNNLIMYLAHDLKTPLTSVLGYLVLLEENPELSTEQRAKYIGIARAKAERLEELIGEFFDITRLTLTTMTLNRSQIHLSRMLEQIVSESEPLLMEKGVRWQADIMPDVYIDGDADKLQRVLDNLIRNAVSYSYPDTALQLTMRQNTADSVEISLRNSGPTIPKEKLKMLFEQFYRLDEARGTESGGAGHCQGDRGTARRKDHCGERERKYHFQSDASCQYCLTFYASLPTFCAKRCIFWQICTIIIVMFSISYSRGHTWLKSIISVSISAEQRSSA